jgi:hypothetical protein
MERVVLTIIQLLRWDVICWCIMDIVVLVSCYVRLLYYPDLV